MYYHCKSNTNTFFSPLTLSLLHFFFQPEQQIWKVICGLISSSWSKIITVFSSLCTVLVFAPVQANWISAQAKVWKCYARKVWIRSCLWSQGVLLWQIFVYTGVGMWLWEERQERALCRGIDPIFWLLLSDERSEVLCYFYWAHSLRQVLSSTKGTLSDPCEQCSV